MALHAWDWQVVAACLATVLVIGLVLVRRQAGAESTNTAGVYACLATAAVVCPLLIADSQSHFLPFMAHPLLRPWLHGAFVAFLVCMAALVAGSLASAPPAAERLATTTLAGMRAQPREAA